MGSRVFLSNTTSDVSGYKMAHVDMKDPLATTTAATLVTDTTASGDNIEMTDTAGGTETNFITKPFFADVAIAGTYYANIWGKESAAAANAGVGIRLAEYTTSEQAAFDDDDYGTELTTTTAAQKYVTSALTGATIDAGNRLVIDLRTVAVGTMGASQTTTIAYADSETDVDGDSFVMFDQQIRVNEMQFGNGTTIPTAGKGVGTYQEFIDFLNSNLDILFTEDETVRCLLDDLEFIRDAQ
jgi:hypothetical protein